jgi:hypothetical protein
VFLICIILVGSQYGYGQTIAKGQKPVSISGALGGNLSYYNMNGIPERRLPYGYSLFGNVNLRLYGWSLPFSIAISQQGTSFTQPFRQIGVSPNYKWIKLHLGYRVMQFSEFTLNNVTFLGAGVELRPGKFRFSAMVGRFREARREAGDLFRVPQFERNGYSFSIGAGKKSHVDLVFFKASDEVNSISDPDSIAGLHSPEANTAIGLVGKVQLIENKLFVNYDLAASAYTRDLRSPELESEEDALQRFGNFVNVNRSSNLAGAANAGLQYQFSNLNAGVQYRYIQPGYRSLGVNYLISDLEMITMNLGGNFFQNKVNVNGSYGIQNNNLSQRRFASSSRNIGSLNANIRATQKLNLNFGYSNFSMYQTLLLDTLFADSVLIDQTNHLITASATYLILSEGKTHTIGINTNFQDLTDNRATDAFSASNRMVNLNLTYGIRFNSKGFGLTAAVNYQEFGSVLTAQTRYGATVGGNATLLEKKMTLRLTQAWNQSVTENRGNDQIFSIQFTMAYRLMAKHSVSLGGGVIARRGNNDFTESRISLGYRMQF